MACYRVANVDSGIGESSNYSEDSIEREKRRDKSLREKKHYVSVFIITFIGYALFHVTRKTFSNVKKTMSDTWSPYNVSFPDIYDYNQWNSHHMYKSSEDASFFLGTLDTVFMISYSVGLYISGAVGDRLDLRKVLSFGMCTSAVTVFLFGYLSEVKHIYNYYWYIIFWSLTGLLQSTGWPTVVAVIGNWFGKSSRGLVMGIWSASPSIGNILGAYTVAGVLHYGYEYAFLVPACITFAGGILVYFSLIPSPREVGCFDDESDTDDMSVQRPLLKKELPDIQRSISDRPTAIGFFHAFLLPGVLPYSLAYACLKLVNYSFFFWLPFYLQNAYGWGEAEADKLSVWYDVGGIFGGILGGYISDKLGTRSPIVAIMLILSPPSLFIYNASPPDKLVNAILMTITGFFIGGVASLISTAIAADLGKQKEMANKEALATVTGIIDGTGSAGAAAGQLLIPVMEQKLGWSFVFYFFMIMTFFTLVCISKIVYKDVRDLYLRRKRRNRRSTDNPPSYEEIGDIYS